MKKKSILAILIAVLCFSAVCFDGNWAVNTEGGVDELTMILPLAV